jgi:signal transduction histidine kinase
MMRMGRGWRAGGGGEADDPVAGHRSRWVPWVGFALVAVVAVGTTGVVGGVVRDQEQRLLDQQADAAEAVIGSSFSQMTGTLPLLGALAQPEIGSPVLFDTLAGSFAGDDGIAGVARVEDGTLVVRRVAGEGIAEGDELPGSWTAVADRAVAAEGLVAEVTETGGERRLMLAAASPGLPDTIVFAELSFAADRLDQGTDSPFRDLDGAIYVGPEATRDDLLMSTTGGPITGTVARRTVELGADRWLVVVTPKRSLVGGFAEHLHWYVLAAGLLAAVLVGLLLASITRRQSYARALVDLRTAELREALAEQERLQEGQRLARQAAEEANRAKDEFLSRMSHELRTPLNAVLGFAQLLEIEDLDDDGRDSVKQILKGGRHLLDLINEVLDIARIEAGTFQLSPEPVSVAAVIDDVLQLTAPLAASEGIQLVGGPAQETTTHVLADHQRLIQILLNLVGNAIKYNRAGGTVVVSSETIEPSRMRITVHDTGPGIRPEQRDLLFTPFERLGAENTAVEGTGVGLALSRRLAEAMGGTIDVDSTIGQGSTFWVELPLVEGPVERFERLHQTPAAAAGPDDVEAEVPRAKVLYIEDNQLNLRLVKRILDQHPGIELITAMQGRLGFELAREHQPKLVLLDLHLSDIGGDEVLRQLRDDPRTAAIPVVVISADATPGQVRRLIAEGASSYLTKPLDVQALRQLLDEVPIG